MAAVCPLYLKLRDALPKKEEDGDKGEPIARVSNPAYGE